METNVAQAKAKSGSRRIGKSAGNKRPTSADDAEQATVEEFEREGLGVAPKE